jgi:GNAT superfamily N-acetyltransferase
LYRPRQLFREHRISFLNFLSRCGFGLRYDVVMGGEIIQIREAKPDDAVELARVHEETWRSTYQGIIPHLHLERMIARRGPRWWHQSIKRGGGMAVMTFNGQPQGYASYGPARHAPNRTTGEIFELYIAPCFQGLGMGKKLFVDARRNLERRGLRGLIIWALAENEPACDFYSWQGGKRVATAPEQYGRVQLQKIAFSWAARKVR